MSDPRAMDRHAYRANRTVGSLSVQQGLLVVRPGYAAFLPTRATTNIGAEVGWAVAGFVTLRGRAATDGLAARGEATFDEAVRALAAARGALFEPDQGATWTGGAMFRGQRMVALRQGGDEVAAFLPPRQDPAAILAAFPRGVARFEHRRLLPLFGCLTGIPALFALICAVAAVVERDWTFLLGVPFWGVLVVLGWGGYLVAWLRHRSAQARAATPPPPPTG